MRSQNCGRVDSNLVPYSPRGAAEEQAASFLFAVTWSSLITGNASAAPGASRAEALPVAVPAVGSLAGAQWSMVVPAMPGRARPVSPSALPTAHAPEPPWTRDTPRWLRRPRFAAPRYLPRFEAATQSASLAVKVLLIAVLAGLLVPGWKNDGSPGSQALRMESSLRSSAWIPVSIPGRMHEAGQLFLYRRSLGAADYSFDFNWRPDPVGVGVVVRAKDADNYYAVTLKLRTPGPSPSLAVERFAVYRGAERPRAEKVLALPGSAPDLQVRLDVSGPVFRLSLDGNPVDRWTDSRLSAGGAGFLEEGGRSAPINSVHISLARRPTVQTFPH